jgi:protoporphyrinogen oxidase
VHSKGGHDAIVIGAGPAGLAAAHELACRGLRPLVVEKAERVGGIARTEVYKGYRFDIGGHRFFTGNREARDLWRRMLGPDLLTVRRASRIYHRGSFLAYPLELGDVLRNAGPGEGALMLLSYLRARLGPSRPDSSFEDWVVGRFGRRLYRTFFQAYTEKVWGIPCSAIQAEWARQRIGGLSLSGALRAALFGGKGPKILIGEFGYPRLGSGMMWERFAEAVGASGGSLRLGCEAVGLRLEDGRVAGVQVRTEGNTTELAADAVISSMSLPQLVRCIEPAAPPNAVQAAAGLRHRSMVLVALIIGRAAVCPDQWIYVQDPALRVGRVQNFANWSAAMSPDPSTTCLLAECFCTEGDELWRTADERLFEMAAGDLATLGLVRQGEVTGWRVVREPAAYPVYDSSYAANVRTIRDYLAAIPNLQTIGRNGMHRYDNMDDAMLTGMRAARKLVGEDADPWASDASIAEQP